MERASGPSSRARAVGRPFLMALQLKAVWRPPAM